MTPEQRYLLALVSRLLEYPDDAWFDALPEWRHDLENGSPLPAASPEYAIVSAFLAKIAETGRDAARESYVSIFDHDPATSPYLAWHRYGNDRSQGRAMAALNGLYRAAGFEPLQGSMPDYLPRMLEFLAICEDWAAEAMLDGFGPELDMLLQNLKDRQCEHAPLLEIALEPLRKKWPERFQSRSAPDATLRPMACPEPEPSGFCVAGCGACGISK